MHPSIAADQNLRELALSEARNTLGPNEPLSVFLSHECLTLPEYEAIARNPQYQRYLKDFKADLTENGFSFSAKARVLAEDLLADIYRMAKDTDTPAAMRVKTLENLVDWGRLAPKVTADVASGPGYSITISLNGAPKSTQITLENEEKPKFQGVIMPIKAPKPDSETLPRLTMFPEPDADTALHHNAEAFEAEFGRLTP
tara:strand:- start:1339 stop:1938 length:600 start_codon:yes stop_codon:yes gene_type:complete